MKAEELMEKIKTNPKSDITFFVKSHNQGGEPEDFEMTFKEVVLKQDPDTREFHWEIILEEMIC